MSGNTAAVYDESKIKTLSSIEHIRLRTGMYIGRLGDGSNVDDGIYILLKEVIDNSVDEFIMGYGKRIRVRLDGSTCSVRDYGRGIPLGKLLECVSEINTGAKYNTDVFMFSVGLNGVGTKAVNALSEHFQVTSYRDGQKRTIVFSRGVMSRDTTEESTERNGTLVEFTPDREVFGNYSYRMDFLEKRVQHYAFLNSGLKIQFNDKTFISENGLQDLLEHEAGEEAIYPIFYFREKTLEFAFTHTSSYGERYLSFANGQYTSAGGSHLSAFKEGILKGVNAYSSEKFTGDDVRDGITAAISIKLKDPVFESQTKNKLGNSDIRRDIVLRVQREIEQMLHRDSTLADQLINKVKANQKLRTELQTVKKKARARAKQTAIRIPKLKDCKIHLGSGHKREEESSIFLTEGLSAAGSLVASRDVMTQAVYALKGKPLNVFSHRRDTVYQNEEIYNIMRALNIEGGVEGLRYNSVILATDADVDGLHIRNLLMTLFLHFFEDLVLDGHLFILETPLFRVRNKKETLYCYSDEEKEQASARLGRKAEVTRFKGLGEISPGEFGQFIGKGIRLQKVGIDRLSDVSEMLSFYMGKNTPSRRKYIMENLR
ncbi:DNA topoisomerase IV [Candidatus Fermentibacteria bacterium]|nr:MAG: DNA topoisomerase IV [Candidatus Fermentibacteria bacterium]PIE53369.1 MAG: DNA topoisomerase IV [Candidatus Fermentibacteria bacterium]